MLNKIDITPAQHLKIAEALSIKDEIYLDCIKKLLAPMIQEAVKEELNKPEAMNRHLSEMLLKVVHS